MAHDNSYEFGLDKNAANFVALSPCSFLKRSAHVYPKRTAIIYADKQYTWAETYARCRRLASALAKRGLGVGDTIAVMLPNVPAMIEAHFGIPMSGAVINTLNTRLDAEAIAFMLRYGEAKALLTDREYSAVVEKALQLLGADRPLVIDVDDPLYDGGKSMGPSNTRLFWWKAIRLSNGPCPPTNGTRSRLISPPAPRGMPRAWFTITAAPISMP